MDEKQIVDLFFERNEDAIKETERKYSRYCNYIAANILESKEDCEECVINAEREAASTTRFQLCFKTTMAGVGRGGRAPGDFYFLFPLLNFPDFL